MLCHFICIILVSRQIPSEIVICLVSETGNICGIYSCLDYKVDILTEDHIKFDTYFFSMNTQVCEVQFLEMTVCFLIKSSYNMCL